MMASGMKISQLALGLLRTCVINAICADSKTSKFELAHQEIPILLLETLRSTTRRHPQRDVKIKKEFKNELFTHVLRI